MERKGYEFQVKVIPPDEAEALGLLEKLEELEEKDIKLVGLRAAGRSLKGYSRGGDR